MEKDEEIRQLKDSLKYKFNKYEKMEQNEILEAQYHKIQEFMYSSIKGPISGIITKQKIKVIQGIIDEKNKCKNIINELIEQSKNNKVQEMQAYLEKLSMELPNTQNMYGLICLTF